LELGGNAPVIIFPDYFTEKREYVAEVVGYLMAAKFRCSGQTCVSPNRIYIHESLLDDFISIAQDKLKDLDKSVGDNFGPLINEAALDKVDHHVQDARTKGAKVQVGGERYHDRSGYFYKPTLLTDVKDGMLVFKEETFGPVLAVSTFRTEQEVMQRVNANVYGLAGYIFSKSASRIRRVSENIEVGMVGVNTGAISHENSPFGGIKLSGFGREGHSLGLHEYTQVKYIAELK
jgi:succinate-semialdehyde dehydrogenase/glutarate-semialdehyde dehydrogenase